jgi:hypothetical protein
MPGSGAFGDRFACFVPRIGDLAAAVAVDVSDGGRSIIIRVITHYAAESFQHDDKLHAYLDDSTSADGNIVCSAGYLFEASMAREFRNAWEPFLASKYPYDKRYFHATDDIRRPDAEEIFSTLARLAKRTAFRGLVNLLEPEALESLHESIRPYVGSAFSVSTLGCMKMMAEVAKDQKKTIVYLIEDGNQFAGELRHFLIQIKDNPIQVDNYALALADTAKKTDVIQLQAADLFAWSCTQSHYQGGWVPSMRELVQDRTLRHTMSTSIR